MVHACGATVPAAENPGVVLRSEEHTSELQSHSDLVCRLLLDIKRAHVLTPVTQLSRMPSSDLKLNINLRNSRIRLYTYAMPCLHLATLTDNTSITRSVSTRCQ